MKNIKKFFLNAIILCAVSMLMRTVGVSFNVYVSNRAGAEAMGLYALLSSVYGFSVTFATSGINFATMRLVAKALGKNDRQEASAVLKRCIIYSLIFSSAASAFLFSASEFIGVRILNDERTILSLKILSVTLVPISLSSTFNGYFTAVKRVYKNAIIQVCEQAIKIFAVSSLLSLFIPKGIEFACAALALGGGIAEVSSFLLSGTVFLIDKRKALKEKGVKKDYSYVTSDLMKTALPIASSTYARSGLISLEHMLIPIGLAKYGLNKSHSLSLYGIIQSMVLPIVLFPAALISSFSGLLVPELTECAVKNNNRQIRYICERSLQLALIFSIGTAGIVICFSGELGKVIYPNENTSAYIKLLAPLIPIMYIDTTVDHMLKGLGEQFYSMIVNIADALLSVFLVWLLLPQFGIIGYIITIYVSELINASLSIVRLMKKSGFKTHLTKWIIKPLICITGATCLCHIIFSLANTTLLSPALKLATHILATLLAYALMLVITDAFDRHDIVWIARIFKKETSIKSNAGDYSS
ncbi:MAG: polysaccharide biosynthesis C-terminal domain-containing protein [Clostridia bacterium]|nr:polysaccharide biosynthesis C-terminal domain-containing protein [Clostridia bacterium]